MTPGQVRWVRKRLGVTGTELAALLGVNPTSVRRWESGTRNVSRMAARSMRALVAAKKKGAK